MITLTAKDIMMTEVMSARADWSLDRLAEFFIDNYISGAPVVAEDGELIGVVSLTDIVRHNSFRGNDLPPNGVHDYYFQILESRFAREEMAALRILTDPGVTVSDIMTPTIFDVDEDTNVRDIADTMIRGHIHRVFVMRGKRVVGIVTTLDMLQVVRDYL